MDITISKNRYLQGKGVKTLQAVAQEWNVFIKDFENPCLSNLSFYSYSSYLTEFYNLEDKERLSDNENDRRKELKGYIDSLKFHGGYYFGGTFESNTRGNAVTSKSLITLDIDNISPDIDFLDLVQNNSFLKPYEYIIHSTAKHFPKHQRYRLIIPLEEALTEDIALKYECIARHVANTIMDISKFDKTAFDDTHLMLYPVIAQETPPKYYTYYHNETNIFLNSLDILSQYNYHDRYTFVGVERPTVQELPPTPQKLYNSSSDLITSRDKDNLRIYIAQELQENNISVPDVTSTKKFGCVCGSSDACNFGRGYVCNCFSSNHDSRLGKRGNGVYTYDIFDLYAYTHNLDTSRDFIKICYELSRKYNITLENSEQVERFLYKPTAIDGFQGVRNTTVAHHNANSGELPPVPEITPENITSSDVLSYMLSLHTEIDILNYIQLLKDKAREYKKLKDVEALCNAYKKEAFKRLEEQERAKKKSTLPDWVLIDRHGNTNVDEPQYIKSIINVIGIKTINGKMLTPNGEMQNGKISSIIQNDIEPYVKSNLAVKTKNIVLAIKNKSYCEKLPEDTQNIHFTNGTYNITSRAFENKKMWCVNRLAVKYNKNAEKPIRWLNFLEELLRPTDILTIQEMCGYFLIPETRLQTMTFLIGDGGEGKSIIGRVLTALFGLDNVYTDKLHELQDSRFKLANCENKLLFIDDDMKMGALAETDIIKTFANGGNMSVERKGMQSYLANIYTRALCFGNGTLSSLYDHTHGFYRRQLTIRVKPKDRNRQDNLFLDKQIIDNELEGVLLWCLEGLHRLIDSEFKLTISPEAQKELEDAERKANPLIEFLESDLVEFSPNYNATTREIFDAYKYWVYIQGDNDKRLTQPDKITKILKSMAENNSLPIRYDKNLKRDYSKSALRGFKGIHIKTTNGNYIDKNTYTPC